MGHFAARCDAPRVDDDARGDARASDARYNNRDDVVDARLERGHETRERGRWEAPPPAGQNEQSAAAARAGRRTRCERRLGERRER